MITTTIEQLKNIISNELDVNIKAEDIEPNVSLFEDGLDLDSLSIVELISLIEEDFEFRFVDDDLSPENFQNLTVLAQLISERQK